MFPSHMTPGGPSPPWIYKRRGYDYPAHHPQLARDTTNAAGNSSPSAGGLIPFFTKSLPGTFEGIFHRHAPRRDGFAKSPHNPSEPCKKKRRLPCPRIRFYGIRSVSSEEQTAFRLRHAQCRNGWPSRGTLGTEERSRERPVASELHHLTTGRDEAGLAEGPRPATVICTQGTMDRWT